MQDVDDRTRTGCDAHSGITIGAEREVVQEVQALMILLPRLGSDGDEQGASSRNSDVVGPRIVGPTSVVHLKSYQPRHGVEA